MLIDFYMVHYNIGAVALLLLLVSLFLIIKKNYKFTIVFLAVFIVLNLFVHSKTANKQWTREFYRTDEVVSYPVWNQFDKEKRKIAINDTTKITFAVKNPDHPWVSYSESGDTLRHWCWVDEWWEKFSQTDLVAWIWGENAGKKVRGSSEERLKGNIGE
jgi:hypothetical protein